MANVSGTGAPMMRLDTSRADRYLYAEAPKLTFMQKLGRTVGKLVSFAAPIAGAVASFIPGIGLPIAAGCFGVGKFSGDMVRSSYAKQQNQIAEQQSQMANTVATTPGLFENQLDTGAAATQFITAPPQQFETPPSLQGPALQTVIIRDGMRGEAVANF